MLLSAFVDLGVSFPDLREGLHTLSTDFRLVRSKATRGGIRGTRIRVEAPNDPGHRHLRDFRRTLQKSGLPSSVRSKALELLQRIFEAEARVHGKKAEDVHLHELGSLDTLVDVVGAVLCVEMLAPTRITSSAVNLGAGHVDTEHGRLAVPAPATLILLDGAPVFSDGGREDFERTTPTGALLVSGLTDGFVDWPAMTVRGIGYGLGSRDPREGRPNALRAVIGDVDAAARTRVPSSIWIVQTTVDDMTPEQLAYLQRALLGAGALDVYVTSVLMKKGRPGFDITVMVEEAARLAMSELLLRESSTFGVRSYAVEREVLDRRSVDVQTAYGAVRVKEGVRDGGVIKASPEYEDCRRISESQELPLADVQQAAMDGYRNRNQKKRRSRAK
jgi:uncharacterized protein (TIGR00299 family) protein